MEKQILEIIAENGIAGVALGIVATLFWYILKYLVDLHKNERDEWRISLKEERDIYLQNAKESREKTDTIIKEFTEVIKLHYSNPNGK